MPCVGGYIESPISNVGTGNMNIINGKDRSYGFKSIALIQTSDNRKETHADLGKYSTWIKWAEPTAEALRQACLAKNSRISQDIPVLPPIFVTSLDISNSKFLSRIFIEFNNQYNAIIGGRGTGKSTILEYLRWGLCDQLSDLAQDDDELPNYQERRKKLIEKTLLPFDATVQVAFMKNGVTHIVRRKAKSGEILLKIGNGEFELCNEDSIRTLLPIQAYSQKQLSNVGVSSNELKRLIYSPIRQILSENEVLNKNLQVNMRACYEKRNQYQLLQTELDHNELELKSVSEQVANLRNKLSGISEEDRNTIDMHEAHLALEQLVEDWMTELSLTIESLETALSEIACHPTAIPDETIYPPTTEAIFKSLSGSIVLLFEEIKCQLADSKKKVVDFSTSNVMFNDNKSKWLKMLLTHKLLYESAKERSSSQQVTLTQITQLEERAKELRQAITNKKQMLNKIGNQEELFRNLQEQCISLQQKNANVIQSQCDQLSTLSNNNLRATLRRNKGTDNLNLILKSMLAGSNVRKEKIDSICTLIESAASPINDWFELIAEFEKLSLFSTETNTENFPIVPKLSSTGLSQNDLKKMSEKLNCDNLINLYLVNLENIPVFEYRTREQEYIDFNDASAGQQATALIHILLNQEGPTLIIDQPEEDLDNQMISEIADLICDSKKKRQLIFTSHNANIVVNGDAELVACCDYRISGDQSNGEIKHVGAIDISDIRNDITTVMEGGEKAFKLRKEKYGF